MLSAEQRCRLGEGLGAEVKYNHPLARYTTLRIGGTAAAFVTVAEKDELAFVLQFCRRQRLPFLCLGKGSNILLAADSFDGVVCRLAGEFAQVAALLEDENRKKTVVRAGAGISLAGLSAFCTKQGVSGVEFAAGIPGTVGGAVRMNAGAWGADMAGIIRCVELQGAENSLRVNGVKLDFGYRSWPWFSEAVRENEMVITAVELALTKESPAAIAGRCRELAGKRKKKQRITRPNAGSFFKNPAGESAGRLIESCGLKGLRIGDAMVAEEHANFFVNIGAARAVDMLELMRVVQEKVKRECGVELEPEVRIIR